MWAHVLEDTQYDTLATSVYRGRRERSGCLASLERLAGVRASRFSRHEEAGRVAASWVLFDPPLFEDTSAY